MHTPTTAPLLLEREGAIATLRFNRPEALNAIDVAMATALLAAVQSIATDPGVRAVVLCGNGKGSGFGNFYIFPMHAVTANVGVAHWAKGAIPYI